MSIRDITPEEERALIESTERGEWRSIGNREARRQFWRESAQLTLREADSEPVIRLLVEAVRQHRRIAFRYVDQKLTAEPYILGFDHQRHLVLTGVQISEGAGSGWRSYRVKEMTEIVVLDTFFAVGAADHDPIETSSPHILAQYEEQMGGFEEVLAKAA